MSKNYDKDKWLQDKLEKEEELKKELEIGIKRALSSDYYKEYLKTMSKFNNYSANNILLILSKKEDASLVKSVTEWNKDGVHVKKEELKNGIKIFQPVKKIVEVFKKDKEGKFILDDKGNKIKERKKYLGFKIGEVFDISQTNAINNPKYNLKKESDKIIENKEKILNKLEKFSNIKFEFCKNMGRANGCFIPNENRIKIRDGMGDIKTISTAIHETAHSVLHNKNSKLNLTRQQQEFEAESVAYVVCKRLNVDSKENNFLYLANWTSSKESLDSFKDSIKRIRDTSKQIIDSLDLEDEYVKNINKVKDNNLEMEEEIC